MRPSGGPGLSTTPVVRASPAANARTNRETMPLNQFVKCLEGDALNEHGCNYLQFPAGCSSGRYFSSLVFCLRWSAQRNSIFPTCFYMRRLITADGRLRHVGSLKARSMVAWLAAKAVARSFPMVGAADAELFAAIRLGKVRPQGGRRISPACGSQTPLTVRKGTEGFKGLFGNHRTPTTGS